MADSLDRWRAVARAAYADGDGDRLERACEIILRAAPDDLEARRLLARDALRDHRLGAAEELFRAAAAHHPARAGVWADLARALVERRALGEAEAVLAAAASRGVRSASTQTFLGRLRLALGRSDDARAAFEGALELDADYGDAYRGLAEAGGLTTGDPWRAAAQRRLAEGRFGPRAAAAAQYALGEALWAEGEGDRALAVILDANARQHALWGGARDRWTPTLKRAARAAARGARVRDAAPETAPVIVVILGPLGGGGAVVEEALGAVSAIDLGGATGLLTGPIAEAAVARGRRALPAAAWRLSADDRTALARDYLRRLAALCSPDEFASDSDEAALPNTLLAAALFANARFVQVTRDLSDAGLAVLRRASPSGAPHTCAMPAIGEGLTAAARALSAFANATPVTTVAYEDVIADPAGAGRRLAQSLDIPLKDKPAPPAAPAGMGAWAAASAARRVAPGEATRFVQALTPLTAALSA